MSIDNIQRPYTLRFKGVENFLRRVAFNLGNTASQTEVKIISCIPIDVTDLQQKIISLEKQLYEAQQQAATLENMTDKHKEKSAAVVNTALFGPAFAKQSSTVSYCSKNPINKKSAQVTTYLQDCSSRTKKSNVSFVFPALSKPDTKLSCTFGSHENSNNETVAAINRCRNIFKKRKRKKAFKGNNKIKTHLVYYAHQTSDNPFKINDVSLNNNKIPSDTDELCLSHLNNVIQRQYNPNEVIEEFSETSHFSKPICRDVGDSYRHSNRYESDVCSCCHDKFQNIDSYMTKNLNYSSIIKKMHNSFDDTKVYYDSKHYDIIPVKENSNKLIKNNTMRKNETTMDVDIKCCPAHFRPKQRFHPFIINYQTETFKHHPERNSPDIQIKNKHNRQNINIYRNRKKKSDEQTGVETSKSCCIECGDIYQKKFSQQAKSRKYESPKTMLLKNESVATDEIAVTKLEVNNQSTQLECNTAEDCREFTLNQIKSILQSVLEEVKTNTNFNNNLEEVIKKDAFVQKDTSQNNLPGESTLLHTYTYNNSYNANPYLASYSRQINNNAPYCFASVPYQPVKCLQNFPVFIQPASGRHMCACYYKKSSCKPNTKQAASAATNTDKEIKISNSKETEKLIKEIYKSVTLNMDFLTKDSSTSEYNHLQPSEKVSASIKDDKKEVFEKNNNKVEALVSPFQSNLNQNKLVFTSATTQSEDGKQTSASCYNNLERKENRDNIRTLHRSELHSTDTIIEDDEETDDSSDESDSVETVILEKEYKENRKTKKGFLSRMLKSVNLFKKKKEIQKQRSESEEEKESSDSDDYETIYSERTAKMSPRPRNEKETYKKTKTIDPSNPKEIKRYPYMEQEYRRQWNENLIFGKQQESKCSSERPFSRHSNSKPVYWTNYEARNAIVDHKLPNQSEIIDPAKCDVEQEISKENNKQNNRIKGKFDLLNKMGANCGEQWKNIILEN